MVISIYRVADFLIFIFHILKCYYSTLKYYYKAGNNFFPGEVHIIPAYEQDWSVEKLNETKSCGLKRNNI